MSAPSSHRRFQFPLRTLMMGVTLLAVACWYVAGQAKIVRERKQFIAAHSSYLFAYRGDPERPRPSWIRERMGDALVCEVGLPIDATKAQRAEAATRFPEALISAINPKHDVGFSAHGEIPPTIRFPDEPDPPQ
jgi:hypothetical protein